MTRADIVGGLLLAAGFGAVLWEASSFQYGTEFAPGPGFAPIWYAGIGLVLSLLVAADALRTKWDSRHAPAETPARGDPAPTGEPPIDKAGLARVAATLLGLIVMLWLVPWLGLVPAVFVLLLFLTLVVQRMSILPGIGTSLATACAIYLVFVLFLGVPVPTGPLGL